MRHDPRRLDADAYPWSVTLGTRFGDLDRNDHLNNVAAARLYEEARVRFTTGLRAVIAPGALDFVVAHAGFDYLAEGRYPADVTVGIAIAECRASSFVNAMAMFQDGRCIGLGETVLVHLGADGPAPLPQALRDALGEYQWRG